MEEFKHVYKGRETEKATETVGNTKHKGSGGGSVGR